MNNLFTWKFPVKKQRLNNAMNKNVIISINIDVIQDLFILDLFTMNIMKVTLQFMRIWPYRVKAPHGEQVCHHGAEPGGEAGLGNEAKLELRQADDVITLFPVPAGDVQKIRLGN